MNVHSHYENLMVSRNAPPEVIRAAYKALSMLWHPDRSADPRAPSIMKTINVAYETLSDPRKRLEHDEWLAAEELRWTLNHPSVVRRPPATETAPEPKPAPKPEATPQAAPAEKPKPEPVRKRYGAFVVADEAALGKAMRRMERQKMGFWEKVASALHE